MALGRIVSSSSSDNIIPTYVVDSFTDQAFKGNPAGVCIILKKELSSEQMLLIAQELGHSETAFVSLILSNEKKLNSFTIRYFSPKMEIPLCGHATLAAAKVVFEYWNHLNESELHFYNIQMLDLVVKKKEDMISMLFPAYTSIEATVSSETLDALGIDEVMDTRYNEETKILLLEISSSKRLAQLTPDYAGLVQSIDTVNGIVVTAASDDGEYDFHSRYFWPWSGTNEDPATGGTHTFLTPYWAKKLGKTKLKSFQSSNRTGWMNVELLNEKQVLISSQAKIVFTGELIL